MKFNSSPKLQVVTEKEAAGRKDTRWTDGSKLLQNLCGGTGPRPGEERCLHTRVAGQTAISATRAGEPTQLFIGGLAVHLLYLGWHVPGDPFGREAEGRRGRGGGEVP